jgi:hypothetical protein
VVDAPIDVKRLFWRSFRCLSSLSAPYLNAAPAVQCRGSLFG